MVSTTLPQRTAQEINAGRYATVAYVGPFIVAVDYSSSLAIATASTYQYEDEKAQIGFHVLAITETKVIDEVTSRIIEARDYTNTVSPVTGLLVEPPVGIYMVTVQKQHPEVADAFLYQTTQKQHPEIANASPYQDWLVTVFHDQESYNQYYDKAVKNLITPRCVSCHTPIKTPGFCQACEDHMKKLEEEGRRLLSPTIWE